MQLQSLTLNDSAINIVFASKVNWDQVNKLILSYVLVFAVNIISGDKFSKMVFLWCSVIGVFN